jgi:RHS repeat-associated protein
VLGGFQVYFQRNNAALHRDILKEQANAVVLFHVDGPTIDDPLAYELSGSLASVHADGLGSVVKTTDGVGAAILARRYDVWGGLEVGNAANGHAFTGREWDSDASLYYYRARYYDPAAGRFASEDPIGFEGGINLYAYVLNNPINATDPTGLKLWRCIRKANFWGMRVGNHTYLWDDRTGDNCGMGSPNGGEMGPSVDECAPVPGSDGHENEALACCRISEYFQTQTLRLPDGARWIPYANDCHSTADFSLRCAGLPAVRTPRWGCWGCQTESQTQSPNPQPAPPPPNR